MTASIAKEPQPTRDLSDWTRKGPLPDLPPPRRVSDRPGFGRNLDNASDAGSERVGRDGKVRDLNNWERKGPLSPISGPGREGGRPRSIEGSGFRRSSPAWGEGRSQDGSRPPRRDFQERTPSAAELDNWRARMRPDPPKEPSPAPAVRPKLNLQKRTVTDVEPAAPSPRPADAKSNPFGGARPIDTAAREREVEEKRERLKREAEERAKAERAERQRLAREQAKAERSAPAADTNGSKDSGPETPQGGKNFEILRRAGEDENGMTADHEPEDQVEESGAAETKPAPKETTSNLPSKLNGNWRSGAPQPAAATAEDEEGWSTVSSKQRNNRRGQSGRGFA